MTEIVTEVPGQVIIDLCEKLGIDHENVFRIEIEPRGLIVTHAFRRNEAGKMVVGATDLLRQSTDIKIRWAKEEK